MVALLRETIDRLRADMVLTDRSQMWLPGDLATAVAAASGEAVTNAVRHANADAITVHLDRYAAVVDRLTPLLTALSEGHPVTPEIRQQARIESQWLRALFDEAASNNRQLLQHLRDAIKPAQDSRLR